MKTLAEELDISPFDVLSVLDELDGEPIKIAETLPQAMYYAEEESISREKPIYICVDKMMNPEVILIFLGSKSYGPTELLRRERETCCGDRSCCQGSKG
jgi:hypothetical protein